MDLAVLDKEWNGRVERIQKLVQTIPGVTTSIATPPGGNSYPTLTITWDQNGWGYSIQDCARDLLDGTPSIAVLTDDNPSDVLGRDPGRQHHQSSKGGADDKLQIISMTLKPGEEIIVGRRLRQLLSEARNKKA